MKSYPQTALNHSLISCETCRLVVRLKPEAGKGHESCCPRCRGKLHHRKPDSLSRCWALTITAVLLFIPANLYPMMTVQTFGSGDPKTIFGGVMLLFHHHAYAIGMIVFIASIAVPLAKMVILIYLMLSVQLKWETSPFDRTRLYRVVELVGRWSMLDIFVVSILVALVNLGSIASILPGIAATSFAAVVVVTMIAAESFDPRLIWDNYV